MKIAILVLIAIISFVRGDSDDEFLQQLQRRIPLNTWKAKKANADLELKKRPLGWLKSEDELPLRPGLNLRAIEEFYQPPEHFDAREQWPECKSIEKIWDQSACGSCWAFASSNIMSDRVCIHTGVEFLVSPEDVLSCCTFKQFLFFTTQCGDCKEGGYIDKALDYFVKKGVCSGGSYEEAGTCKPYSISPWASELQPTPSCVKSCTDDRYNVTYADDKVDGSRGSYRVPNNEKAIMEEIQTNGPVATGFIVYEDFTSYESGVYQHSHGIQKGGHAVRIIGWGTENDTPYWLVANSWSETFGENGTFKILRGQNHCDIEANVVAALP